MNTEREKEIRESHGCLIPKTGAKVPACHEYSSCDCTVVELLAEIDRLRDKNDTTSRIAEGTIKLLPREACSGGGLDGSKY